MKVIQLGRTEAGYKLHWLHLFFLRLLASCLCLDMRKPNTETGKQQRGHSNLLENLLKHRLSGLPPEFAFGS